jgi:hypothetical protein
VVLYVYVVGSVFWVEVKSSVVGDLGRMKKLASVLTVVLILCGCSRLRHINTAEFEEQIELNDMQTV